MRSVDVLIVSYNTRELLRDCLESIRHHRPEGASLRVRVLDNDSADGSAEMVAGEFPEVHLVRSERNLGFAAANNRLAEASEADYLLLLNADTYWTTDIVTPLLAELEPDDHVAVAAPRQVFPDGVGQPASQDLPTLGYELALALRGTKLATLPGWRADDVVERVQQRSRAEERSPRDSEFLWATCWLLRRRDVARLGLFDEGFPMYDEDLDFCARVRDEGRRLRYVPTVELVHIGGASSSSPEKTALMRRARRHYYRKHFGALTAAAYAWLLPVIGRLKQTRQVLATDLEAR